MIKFRCGKCNHKIGVTEGYAGKRVKCPKCGVAVPVPDTGQQEEEIIEAQALPDGNHEHVVTPPPVPARVVDDEKSAADQLAALAGGALVSAPSSEPKRLDYACSRCRRLFAVDEVFSVNGAFFCAACLPSPREPAPAGNLALVDDRECRVCPACGEQILVTAKKCKHCGEWLVKHASVVSRPQTYRVSDAAPPRSYVTPAIVTLILYWIGFGIVGIIANFVYLSSANREWSRTGHAPEGRGCLVALLWCFVWIPLILCGLVVIGILLYALGGGNIQSLVPEAT